MSRQKPVGHWRRTRLLAIAVMIVWMAVVLVMSSLTLATDWAQYGGAGGYIFVAEGVLILILALVFWFVHRQRNIDREFAMAEED